MAKTPKRRGMVKPRPEGTLKEAMARLVERVGGIVRAADILTVSQTQIQKCTDPALLNYELKLSQIRALERDCGEPIVTAYLAAQSGNLLVPAEPLGQSRLDMDMARIGDEISQCFKTYISIMADGKTTPRELETLKAKAHRGASAAMAVYADCDALLREGR